MAKPRLVFFGNERLVSGLDHTTAPILSGLIERGYNVVAVVSHHTATRSRKARALEVASIADAHNIPVFLPTKPMDIYDTLVSLQADAAILVAYGRIIPLRIIDIFPRGIINVHPSLLPKYRGPTPIETPILNGNAESGVSIMQLSAKMDEGNIYAQESFAIGETDTKFDVYQKAESASYRILFNILPTILDGSLTPLPQNDHEATYSSLITKTDGIIDWQQPAKQIERQIRAYLGWPGSRTVLSHVECIITKASVITLENAAPGTIKIEKSRLLIATGDGWLDIHTLKPLGKKEMPVQAFLQGYRDKLI